MIQKTKKLFTLIELITVIVVLGILAAIVIPNISSLKEEGKEVAIISDARNIQTAVDMYGLDFNGATPTKEKPTLGNPQIIELFGLNPDYLRDIPKDNGAKFWLDSNNTVWASMVDAPTNVNYANGTLTWDTVDGAELYKIYKTDDAATASIKETAKMKFIEEVKSISDLEPSKALPELTKGTYLVTAIDIFDFESAPTKVGTVYNGYGDGPDKEVNFNVEAPTIPANQKPVAVISMSPESNINNHTVVTWGVNASTDPDNHLISKAEWTLNNEVIDSMPSKLTEGTHVVKLRVQDEKGLWSDLVSKEIIVEKITFTEQTFNFTGTYQTVTIPITGLYKFEVWGAQGGNDISSGIGGKGGYSYGEKLLSQGDILYVYVGGQGNKGLKGQLQGGFNGGGYSGGAGSSSGSYGGSGGGATDFRLAGNSLNQRFIVGGGGGGASNSKPGAHGGGLVGGNSSVIYGGVTSTGGTQTSGGLKGGHFSGASFWATDGSFGVGGNGDSNDGGGAGGGWYGGGGGGNNGPGSGGSSYVGGVTNGSTASNVRTGSGMAKISFIQ